MNYAKTTLLFLFGLPLLLPGQRTSDDMSYRRYEGNIGSSISITANIVQLYTKLSGNYQYRFLEDDQDKMYFGKTLELDGEIDENGQVKLKEFGKKDFAFEGIISGTAFTGNWNAGSDRVVPFEMKEYYPNGSMPFDVHYLRSEKQLVKGESTSPSAEIEITLIYPTDDYINPDVTDSVRRIIGKSLFGSGFKVEVPDSMLVKFEEEYFSEYVKQNEDWHKMGGASFSWEKAISMSVIYNSSYMLCLEYLKYAYSGGAHGMTNIAYDIIYLDNGQLLTFEDVFEEGPNEALSGLLTDQLRKDYLIPSGVPLKDAGFFVDTVQPNRNIYVTGNGIGFLYNSYEIAPYSTGATNIFLEWQQVKALVRKGTPVYEMSQR
jgi:hypothetical protein